jgi:hypothetical protein
MKEWCFLVADFGRLLLVINVLLYLFSFKRHSLGIRFLGLFLMVDVLTEIMADLFSRQHINNMPLLHAYTLLEFIALSFFYKVLFKRWIFFQKWFGYWLTVVGLLLVGNSLFLEPIEGFNSNSKTLVQSIMIGYAVLYFFRSFGKEDFTLPKPLALALINSGVLIYYSGTLFVFMFSKALNEPGNAAAVEVQVVFWLLNGFLFLLFQLLILAALWKTTRVQTR